MRFSAILFYGFPLKNKEEGQHGICDIDSLRRFHGTHGQLGSGETLSRNRGHERTQRGGLFLVVLLAGALRMGYGNGSTGQTEWTSRSRSPER